MCSHPGQLPGKTQARCFPFKQVRAGIKAVRDDAFNCPASAPVSPAQPPPKRQSSNPTGEPISPAFPPSVPLYFATPYRPDTKRKKLKSFPNYDPLKKWTEFSPLKKAGDWPLPPPHAQKRAKMRLPLQPGSGSTGGNCCSVCRFYTPD